MKNLLQKITQNKQKINQLNPKLVQNPTFKFDSSSIYEFNPSDELDNTRYSQIIVNDQTANIQLSEYRHIYTLFDIDNQVNSKTKSKQAWFNTKLEKFMQETPINLVDNDSSKHKPVISRVLSDKGQIELNVTKAIKNYAEHKKMLNDSFDKLVLTEQNSILNIDVNISEMKAKIDGKVTLQLSMLLFFDIASYGVLNQFTQYLFSWDIVEPLTQMISNFYGLGNIMSYLLIKRTFEQNDDDAVDELENRLNKAQDRNYNLNDLNKLRNFVQELKGGRPERL